MPIIYYPRITTGGSSGGESSSVTLSGIGGIVTTLSGVVWYVDGSLVSTSGLVGADQTWVNDNFISNLEMTSISGIIVSQIPEPIVDYVTHLELTTASGDIIVQIPSLVGYATETYVVDSITAMSGVVTQYVDIKDALEADLSYVDYKLTTLSGELLGQIPEPITDYITQYELTTTSGDLVIQIEQGGLPTASLVGALLVSTGGSWLQTVEGQPRVNSLAVSGGLITFLDSESILRESGYPANIIEIAVSEGTPSIFLYGADDPVVSGMGWDKIAFYTSPATISMGFGDWEGNGVGSLTLGGSDYPIINGYVTGATFELSPDHLSIAANYFATDILNDRFVITKSDGDTSYSALTISGLEIGNMDAWGTRTTYTSVAKSVATFAGNVTVISGLWVAGHNIFEYITTVSGDIVAQIPSVTGYATETWVSNNYISNEELTTFSGELVSQMGGTGLPPTTITGALLVSDGSSWVETDSGAAKANSFEASFLTAQYPGLSQLYTLATPGALELQNEFSDYKIMMSAQDDGDYPFWIQRGSDKTLLSPEAVTSTSGIFSSLLVGGKEFFDYITTVSGDIVAQIPSMAGYASETWVSNNYISNDEMATISGNIVSQVGGSSVVTGSGLFTTSGTVITHNLNNILHSTTVSPAGIGDFNIDQVSSIGTIYVKRGADEDIVFKTGNTDSDGLSFDFIISDSGRIS